MVEQSGLDLTPRAAADDLGGRRAASWERLGGLLRQSILLAVVGRRAGGAVPLALRPCSSGGQRSEKLLSQLPDAFDLMWRVIRAGQTMSQALQAVADEFAPPIAGEFAYCYEQQNLGLPPETALRDLGRRTGLLEIKIFVTALLVQQQTGGNLAEMLDKLSGIIRERYQIRGQIKALTAEGRFQGIILLALPAVHVLIDAVPEPRLRRHPARAPRPDRARRSISEAFGAIWIRKIVNFDF